MTDYRSPSNTAEDLAARITAWQTNRAAIFDRESGEGDGEDFRIGDLHDSDDEAFAIANEVGPIVAAVAHLLAHVREAFGDNAERFACSEIEALADLYRATGDDQTANDLIDAHAEGDEPGDIHYDTIACGHCGTRVAFADTREGMCADACPTEATR